MASRENFPEIPGMGPRVDSTDGPSSVQASSGSSLGPPEESAAGQSQQPQSWQGRLLGITFAIFAFEIGLCLVVFPWMDKTWDISYFQSIPPAVRDFWDDPYFRGAITGLGFVNIYIALLEAGRLIRRSPPRQR
jgi:hypothetical protein